MNKKLLLTLFVVVLLLPLFVWGSSFGWDFSFFSLYLLFPPLGLLAFSVMWTQITVSTFKQHFQKYFSIDRFFAWTGVAVLILFVSHPLLAAIAQWQTANLLPLESLFDLVAPTQAIFIILALIAFTIFILFELVMRIKPLHKLIPFFEWVSYIGFFLVWIHSLNLGSHLQAGFLQIVWWIYGISAILMVGWQVYRKVSSKKPVLQS